MTQCHKAFPVVASSGLHRLCDKGCSNLGNPKMAVFFASLLPLFAPGGRASFPVLLALGLLFCALTFVWLTLYAVAIARLGRLLTATVRQAIDAVTGVVLVALGLRLATAERPG